MAVAVVVCFIFIGVFVALMALVTATQKAFQEFARIQQLKVMATEYVVQDLADPGDLGDAAATAGGLWIPVDVVGQQSMAEERDLEASAPPVTAREAAAHAQLERELREMYGAGTVAPRQSEQAMRGLAPGQDEQAVRGLREP